MLCNFYSHFADSESSWQLKRGFHHGHENWKDLEKNELFVFLSSGGASDGGVGCEGAGQSCHHVPGGASRVAKTSPKKISKLQFLHGWGSLDHPCGALGWFQLRNSHHSFFFFLIFKHSHHSHPEECMEHLPHNAAKSKFGSIIK